VPGPFEQLLLEPLQFPLGRPHDVTRAPVLEPLEVGRVDHPAVDRPDPTLAAVPLFHSLDDFLQCRRIPAISGKHLVSQREAFAADDQPDTDLFTVRPMIARIASRGQRVAVRLALEVSARDVVQQEIIFQLEQGPEAFLEVRFERVLVRQEPVQRAIEPVVVDLGRG
jgi:hypothetical protein